VDYQIAASVFGGSLTYNSNLEIIMNRVFWAVSAVVFGLASAGCVKQVSTYKGSVDVNNPDSGCGWVGVDQVVSTTILGLPISSTTRQFDKGLFYCCPGKEFDEPVCYQAEWMER
jgi:hypothetical protein